MRPGHWYRISGDGPDLGLVPTALGTRYLADNDPARDPRLNPPWSAKERLRRLLGREWRSPWRGRVGFRAITEAWNSAVFASRCGPCGSMVVFGGGHADYYGADVHAFDLASRTWARISDGWLGGTPSQYGEGARYPAAHYPNGSPLPPHTYDYVQYDPVTNDYLLAKGQVELGDHVEAIAIPHLFNLTQRRWRHGPHHPHAVLNSGGCSAWDAARRVLWVHSGDDGGGNTFIGFIPDGENRDGSFGRWTTLHDSKLRGTANHNAMQHVPTLDLLVIACHARDALGAVAPGRPDAPLSWLASCGERPRLAEYAALQFAPRSGALVYCAPRDGGAVYAIEPPDSLLSCAKAARWSWRRVDAPDRTLDPFEDAAQSSRGAVNRSHLFGRLRIATFDDGDYAVLVRHVDSPVYAMRLPG
ncbi:hypothetical protein O4H66_18515 [Comamonadaceae bacterium G21597-S1]|nr:hypothetical protein [Comamonadaceae bacterium G21597-S1]